MPLLKGGRGKTAPWESTHVRVPDPIKSEIQQQIDAWKQRQLGGESKQSINSLTRSEVEEIAKEVLKQKKSAKVSVQKLLTEMGYEIDL